MASEPLAFPAFEQEYNIHHVGMTLRDYFAGQAITMCLKDMTLSYDTWATEAYAVADAMLAVRLSAN